MSRPQRTIVIVAVILAALVVGEVAVNLLRDPVAVVRVENPGTEPVVNLVVTHGTHRWTVDQIAPGGAAEIAIQGRDGADVRLSYTQAHNPVGSFLHPGFNPAQMARDGFKQVFRIRPNEVERFQADADPPSTLIPYLIHRIKNLLRAEDERLLTDP